MLQGQTATQVIDALANKLQVPATVIWQTLVLQGRIELIKATLYVVVLAVVGAGLNHWRVSLMDRDSEWDEDWWIPFGMAVTGWTGATIAAVVYLVDALGWLLNPNYFAIDQILSALHGK